MQIHFFVIHVAEHKDRLETFLRRTRHFPSDLFTFEIIDAVVDSPGMEGCRKSHQKVVRIAQERGLECCWILEDDVLFTSVNTILHSSNIQELEQNAMFIQKQKNDYFTSLYETLVWGQYQVMTDEIDYFLGGAHGILHNDEVYIQEPLTPEPQPPKKFRGKTVEIPCITATQIGHSFHHEDYYSPRRAVSYREARKLVSFPSTGTHCICYGSRRAYEAVLCAPPKIHIDVYLSYLTYPHGILSLKKVAKMAFRDITILRSGTVFPFVAIAYTPCSSVRDEKCEYKEEMDFFIGAEQRVQYILQQKAKKV